MLTLETKEYQEEQKKQEEYLNSRLNQADLRSKKLGLISIGIIIALAIAFPYALPLLGGLATLVGVLSLATGASLLCCSVIPAFFGERLIDPQWYKEYAEEQKKLTQKIPKAQEKLSNNVLYPIQKGELKLNGSAATQKCTDKPNLSSCFFNSEKPRVDSEQNTISKCLTH